MGTHEIDERPATEGDRAKDRRGWLPQAFGRGDPRAIADPIVEPLWDGIRVLVHVADGRVAAIIDTAGTDRAATYSGVAAAINDALRDAPLPATDAVIDGYIAADPDQEPSLPLIAPIPARKGAVTQMILGAARIGREGPRPPEPPVPGGETGFAAIDLLVVDGSSLLDVPLLERKRQLESTLAQTSLVRCTPFTRLPLDARLPAWRALGYRGLAYKGANGRYRPGTHAIDWIAAALPQA